MFSNFSAPEGLSWLRTFITAVFYSFYNLSLSEVFCWQVQHILLGFVVSSIFLLIFHPHHGNQLLTGQKTLQSTLLNICLLKDIPAVFSDNLDLIQFCWIKTQEYSVNTLLTKQESRKGFLHFSLTSGLSTVGGKKPAAKDVHALVANWQQLSQMKPYI